MSVAACATLGLGVPLQHRKDTFEERCHGANAFYLRVHFEQSLLEVRIEGKGTGEAVGKLSAGDFGFFRLRTGELHDFAMQADGFFLLGGEWQIGIIRKKENFGLKERTFLINLQHFEAALAFSEDVHTAVVVFFEDVDDFGGAANVDEPLVFGADDAERALLVKAFIDHLFVARLEDVQRQGRAGKQHQIERKKGEERVHDLPIVRRA